MKLFNSAQQVATASAQKIVFPARSLQTASIAPDDPDSFRFGKKPKNLLQKDLRHNRKQGNALKQKIAASDQIAEQTALQETLIYNLEERLDLKSAEYRIEKEVMTKVFAPVLLGVIPALASHFFMKPEARKVLNADTFAKRVIAAISLPLILLSFVLSRKTVQTAIANKEYLRHDEWRKR